MHGYTGPTGATGATGSTGATGPERPFLSSFVEAPGTTQTIQNRSNVVFDTDEDYIEIVGSDISVNATGTVFTINSIGLYYVSWSVNAVNVTQPAAVGLLEDGIFSSSLSFSGVNGIISSGGLIDVKTVPYTISLHNLGTPLSIENPQNFINTAASIRIFKFAEGEKII